MEVRSTEPPGDDVLLLRLGRRPVAAAPDTGTAAADPVDDTVQGYPIGRQRPPRNSNPAGYTA